SLAVLIFLATTVECGMDQEFHRYLDRTYKSRNLIASSIAAQMAVGMLSVGAGGETAEEIWNALDLIDGEDAAERFHELIVAKPDAIEVKNYLYVMYDIDLKSTYRDHVVEEFRGFIRYFDSENGDAKIKKRVNDLTHGRVQKLISHVGPDFKPILLNSVYFKGKWATQFCSNCTEQEQFNVSATKSVPVQMMQLERRFKMESVEDLDARVIELDFEKNGLVMIIYLPNKVDGLAELEQRIDESMRPKELQYLDLRLPKFRISTKTKLKPILNHFGIRKAFEPSANFSGILEDEQRKFFVDDIIQEAFIEINEDGAEATSMAGRTPEMESTPFEVNVPFAYIIRDNSEVYFQGHVIEP
ncbi:hypothetical protein KR032_007536, partial [Drosophila birchii]